MTSLLGYFVRAARRDAWRAGFTSLTAIVGTSGAMVGCRDLYLVDPAEDTSEGGNSYTSATTAGAPSSRSSSSLLHGNVGGKAGVGGVATASGGLNSASGGALGTSGGTGSTTTRITLTSPAGGSQTSSFPNGSSSIVGGSAMGGASVVGGRAGNTSTFLFAGSGAFAGGAPIQGGATQGGTSFGGVSAQGGATQGGTSPLNLSTQGGATQGGTSFGGVSAQGGATQGGTSSQPQATGGLPSSTGVGGTVVGAGGTTQPGASSCTDSSTCGGIPQSMHFGTGGVTNPNSVICPQPITKPKALIDAEPKPNDPCARVTTVVAMSLTNFAFGFTNGEIWYCPFQGEVPFSCTRADAGGNSANSQTGMPKASVSALKSIRHNNEGALDVGYVDALGELTPWHTSQLGRGWSPSTVSNPGTVMSLFTCPFHGNLPTHSAAVIAPGHVLESMGSTPAYSGENGSTIAQHMGLLGWGADEVTSVETYSTYSGDQRWCVFAGSRAGALARSGWIYPDAVTWNDETHKLDVSVGWISLRTSELPVAPVIRVAVDPNDPDRILVVFNRRRNANETETVDALWLSEDGGTTWINRSKGLPTTTNHPYSPSLLGASFHPTLKQVAYVVTPDSAYYTTDSGETWHEW